MDPNATLQAIDAMIGHPEYAESLADSVGYLRDWLRRGGFRPTNINDHPQAWRIVWLSV